VTTIAPAVDRRARPLTEHEHAAVSRSYGHKNLGFLPSALRDLVRAARLEVESSEITSRERRAPYFESVSVCAKKPLEKPTQKGGG